MIKKITVTLMLIICVICITSCKKNEVTIESISIIENTVPTSILNTEVEKALTTIKFYVNKSDNTKEEKTIEKSMIANDDLSKLTKAGKYEITVTYEGFKTTLKLTIEEADDDSYKVKVVYPDNTPVNGVSVQWCTDTNCFMPVVVDNNGVAKSNLKDNKYYVHIESGIPSGYTYDPNAYIATPENKYLEIKLVKLSTIDSGNGTQESPYVLNNGTYQVNFNEKDQLIYFSFTASDTKEYTISSFAMEILATNVVDPYLGLVTSNNIEPVGNNNELINFNYSFQATQGTTYIFVVMLENVGSVPAILELGIYSK